MSSLKTIVLTAVLSSAVFNAGCAGHYRVYDAYRGDYHRWGPDEDTHYHQWIVETHHNSEDYRHLRPDDQRKYWEWRHSH